MFPLNVHVPDANYHQNLISCQVACPVHTDARGYVRAIADGRFEEAYLIPRGPNPFASICGRICGAPCEIACRRGKIPKVNDDGMFVGQDRPIAIRALKRFACDQFGPEARPTSEVLDSIRNFIPPVAGDAEEMAALLRSATSSSLEKGEGEKIAIIGAGPAGLSAAHDLALMGFKPVVFEIEPVAAGMLAVGVPAYRLPRELVEKEVAVIEALGVEIRCGVKVGEDITFAELREDFAAVIIAVGAKSSRGLGLTGEDGPGVLGGVDLLRAVSLGENLDMGREIVVIGGGNVAYDVARSVVRQIAFDTARTAARLSETANVHLISLEGAEEMPADTIEIVEGDEEGIKRSNGWGPTEVVRDEKGNVTGVAFRKCLRVYDEDRKFSPLYDDKEKKVIPCDTVLLAVGQAPALSFLEDGGQDVERMRGDWLEVDPTTLQTTAKGVFVAGDLAHGTRLLIDAVASGKAAARSVYQYLTGNTLENELVKTHVVLDQYRRERGYESIRRVEIPTIEPSERLEHPENVVEIGYSREEAMREASRCLDCGVTPIFDGSRCVLCGGCADVCPTECLKLISLDRLEFDTEVDTMIGASLGEDADLSENSAILKDEDRCIRCALCAIRCPVDAISMERSHIFNKLEFCMTTHPSEKKSRFDPEPMPRRDFLGLAALGSMAAAFALSIFGMLKLPKAAVSASPAKKFNVPLPDTLPEGEAFVPPGRNVAVFRDADGVFAISTVCTHLGCIVKTSSAGFDCPCHGSGFQKDGTVRKGPAPTPLPWLKVSNNGGVLTIDEGATVKTGTKV